MNVREIVADFLRLDVATHKRRCAVRQGRREPDTDGCPHAEHWNESRRWCERCGITLVEIIEASR